ncbi:MAG TPA: hypothetical protein VK452_06320, partial [Dissulfurispiraceae bacterium]|nr:hypothetical protein [Dissulfurispiraceae bacterium]
SEEMASTSEELSSQAEQLQSTISFFKVAEAATVANKLRKTTKAVHRVHLEQTEPESRPAMAMVKPAHRQAQGITLDLGGNGSKDHLDADFERFDKS